MKRRIIKQIDKLSYEQKMRILKYLISKNVKICSHADGVRINLDLIDDDIIHHINEMIRTFLEIPSLFKIE